MANRAFLAGVLGVIGCFGQTTPTVYPTGAHVNLYFPHLADGGPVSGQWQTSLEFVNPSLTLTAHGQIKLYGNQGLPLSMNFGSGPLTEHAFSILPGGTVTLRSTIASPDIVTGQAIVTSDIPILGTVLFRSISNGGTSLEVAAPPTLPTSRYISLANRDLGVALANTTGVAKLLQITVVNSAGTTVTTTSIQIPGFGHSSFNLSQPTVLPNLPANFTGSIVITPQNPGDQFLAWTLNVAQGVSTILPVGIISTLPTGPQEWPISHPDRIQLVFKRLLAVAPLLLAGLGNNLSLQTAPNLAIASDLAVNAFATATHTVQINLALSELVSDSPSELAFLVAHELAHIAQNRSGALTVLLANDPANKEADADLIAMILVLRAGFDPYGAAGAIAKLSMASSSSGLVSPSFDSLADATVAFSPARLNSVPGLVTSACNHATMTGFCAAFKPLIHPHFPGSPPL